MKQIIIAIGREFGSGGHLVAKKLAEHYNIPLYREGVDEKTALNMMKKMDKMRKVYHNFYCESKWGDSRTYDICIKIGKVDVDTATDMIIKYIDSRDN